MRRFIREHPWRLEIIPFTLIVLSVVVPLMNKHAAIDAIQPHHGYSATQIWQFEVILRCSLLVGIWLLGLQQYHWAIINEEKKLFSWTPDTRLRDIQPGEAFYYREMFVTQWSGAGVFMSGLLLVTMIWIFTGRMWTCWFALPPALALLFMLRYRFIISSERLAARAGLRSASIPMKDVCRCSVIGYKPPFPSGGRYTYVPLRKSGPYLQFDTVNGSAYLFGMRNPETACKLIQTAMENRK